MLQIDFLQILEQQILQEDGFQKGKFAQEMGPNTSRGLNLGGTSKFEN